ncbi:septation regulator SpoVG [Candidatus Dependentiae bacterium]|nr:septation regulator SpoVG [Candidatus Dependentiae bacterium]
MKITEVRIKTVDSSNGDFKAWVSITFDNSFVIHNLKIIEGSKGLFVTMPNRKTSTGEYRDIAHPLNNERRELIESTVLSEYKKIIDNH